MENKNMPELHNPMVNLMAGNMPGLPQIIQNSMPVELPRASFQQDSISLFFGNMKRKQLVKATKAEAEIAEFSNRAVKAKLDTIHEIVTFSGKVADTLGAYEYNKDLRRMTLEEGGARIVLLKLEAQEKETNIKAMEANIQQTTYQTALIAQEVEMAKLDHKIKVKQLKEILGED